MAAVYLRRLRGWRFVLFNAVLGLAHIVVLFNAGSYIALLPHVSGDLGGVLPSFLTWAQTDFMVGLALGAWGAVQTTAAGIAIATGGVIRDLVLLAPGQGATAASAYIPVFALEAALLLLRLHLPNAR